jgi:hypothetical protein
MATRRAYAMKPLKKEDLSAFNDIIMELPNFRDLKSKDMLKKVFDVFLEDIYIKQPQEILDMFQFKLSENLIDAFYANYGIDKKYSSRLVGYVKQDIAFELEQLFQNKGSKAIFKILAIIFESVFHRINFYNVEVYKTIHGDGYRFDYQLKPLYISDESILLKEPAMPVDKSRKYLMDLKNFEDYTIWPVPTNLVYVQFGVGVDLINNLNTFLHGMRGYAISYLIDIKFPYLSDLSTPENPIIEELDGGHLELLLAFFRVNLLKAGNPNWEPESFELTPSFLPFAETEDFDDVLGETPNQKKLRIDRLYEEKCEYMKSMAEFFKVYENTNYADRNEMEFLKRKWQAFLKTHECHPRKCCFNLDDLNAKVKRLYPRLFEDYMAKVKDNDKSVVCTFFIKMYAIFFSGAHASFSLSRSADCLADLEDLRPLKSYAWTRMINNQMIGLGTSPTLTYVPTTLGHHYLTLTVENQDGNIASDTIMLDVLGTEDPSPAADAGIDGVAQINSKTMLYGSAKAIPGAEIIRYQWKIGNEILSDSRTDYNFAPSQFVRMSYKWYPDQLGDHEIKLVVYDSNSHQTVDTVKIKVTKSRPPKEVYPIADAGPSLKAEINKPVTIFGGGKDIKFTKIHNEDWIISYIDVIFGNLFLNRGFQDQFFNPIMDLFTKYFFPVEMEYVNEFMHRERIKDKWNSISTDTKMSSEVRSRHTSIQTPIRGVDWAKLLISFRYNHSHINIRDPHGTISINQINEGRFFEEGSISREVSSRNRDYIISRDRFDIIDI